MYKIILILFLIPLTITATDKKGKYTKSKTINKEFKVNSNGTLSVTNKYGNIVIATWNENNIVIDITITTNGNDEEKVENRLKQINVDFDYLIKMPITNNIDLNNDYGTIKIDKLEGQSTINLDYGKLHIGELLNSENNINIDYTNKSTIEFMKDGEINADYSTLHIEKSGKTKLNADYSHISFGMVTSIDYSCDYGDLKIENCGNISGNSDYMHTTVGKLRGTGDFDSDYGSIKINEIGEHIKNIKVTSSYTHLKFGLHPNASFSITASLSYSGFKYGDGFTFNKEIIKNSSKYYEGYYNSPNSDSNITIKSSYGSVTFTNN